MLYQPGLKARAEFRTFTKRGGPAVLEVEPFNAGPLPQLAPAAPPPPEAALIGHGITPSIAAELVRQHGEAAVTVQVEHLEWQIEKKPGKIADPAAWLVSAIKTGHAAPRGFVSKAERRRREDAKQAKEREAAEIRRRKREQEARERAERQAIDAYWESLTKEQQAETEELAMAQATDDERHGPMARFFKTSFRHRTIKARLQAEGKLPHDQA